MACRILVSQPGTEPAPLCIGMHRVLTTGPPRKDLFVLFCFSPAIWHVEILVPQSGIEPVSLQWKHRVLTTGPPGKFHIYVNSFSLIFTNF